MIPSESVTNRLADISEDSCW